MQYENHIYKKQIQNMLNKNSLYDDLSYNKIKYSVVIYTFSQNKLITKKAICSNVKSCIKFQKKILKEYKNSNYFIIKIKAFYYENYKKQKIFFYIPELSLSYSIKNKFSQ